jgi:hypothetical protein
MRGGGRGGGSGASSNEYSYIHGAQINFGDLHLVTPYLTYGWVAKSVALVTFTTTLCGFETLLLKLIIGRQKQRSGRHTLTRTQNIQNK